MMMIYDDEAEHCFYATDTHDYTNNKNYSECKYLMSFLQNCEKANDLSKCQSYVCNWPVSDLIGKNLNDVDTDHLTASSRCYMTYDPPEPLAQQTAGKSESVPRGLTFKGTPKEYDMESFKVPFVQGEWQSDAQNKAVKERMLPCQRVAVLDPRPEGQICQNAPQKDATMRKELNILHQGKRLHPSKYSDIDRSVESDLIGLSDSIAISDTRIQQPETISKCILPFLGTQNQSTPQLRKLYNQTKIKKSLYKRQLHTEFKDALNVNNNPVYMFNNCSKVKMNNKI